MRIVAVADTHTFEADLGALPDGDVFVHAGDMLRGGSLDELASVAEWICALPHRHKVVVAGNHDWCFVNERPEALAALPGVHYLQDAAIELEGVHFYGSPWQPEFNRWAFNLPRGDALAEKWAKIPDGTDVLVTHGPPALYGDRGPISGRAGCEDLLARVRMVRPRLHLFGHIHQDGGAWAEGGTSFVNVSTWECERRPTVIDLVDGRVSLVEVPPPHA